MTQQRQQWQQVLWDLRQQRRHQKTQELLLLPKKKLPMHLLALQLLQPPLPRRPRAWLR